MRNWRRGTLTEGITVNVHNVLGQVAGELKSSDQLIRSSQLLGKINLFEMALLYEDLLDLRGKIFIPFLFVVEEL